MAKIIACSKLSGGHRRAGFYIPDTQVELEADEAQLKELKEDSKLVIVELASVAPAPVKAEAPKQDDSKPSKK